MATIYISLGSNIEADTHIRRGLDDLARQYHNLIISSVFESEAVGFEGDNFLNLVARAETDQPIGEVVATFKAIEQAHGRKRGAKKFAPRTLDLDLLLYDEVQCQSPVELPRPEIYHNAFVLWPLAELAPDLVPPGQPHPLGALWQAYDKTQQQLWPVPFAWPRS
ncbi:2-amino-4-hydroxy-6-hydroxymethyldihydropteridine diphosphokinase [Ferrimonas balearica]|uniref:2-amino-4-hydroxy-6- hydroxymethyldihydropteridine diphosphokinase n=1 Tax=Ferrimonas balearica TaxID=44012 RepID=UPI001C568328|nr:2-amino-4-hydroxy-6-hydroxymethyldihydropteridine diphosphokinase [Ferrimonas balearica]MBW3164572.1 2-amino-4-hydroxy-6-hydroxymethyldihydropteridine diphosphokinase [Ferrimonas balearica]MBY6226400.1 2-amino-4-hydroxy-6-hydroxymethyldihydropteridine diphosphokinase [Ferrimonas balearica]